REHPDSAQTINNIAELYRLLGNPAEAQPRYELSIAIRQRTLGPEHPLVAQSLNNIANLLRTLGRYDEAEPRYRRSLEIRSRAFGDMHPVVATSWNNLAMLAQHRGLWAQAIAGYERSLAMREQLLGAAHPLIATSLANLASAHLDAGQGAAADPLLLRAERTAAASGNRETLWRARFGLMRRHADAKPELAIFWGKLSVNTIQQLRGTLTALDNTIQQSFLLSKREVFTGLADLLLQGGRVIEAQRVIELLKEEEFFDFIRRDQQTDTADRRIPLTGRERHAERRHTEASARLAGLEREHAEWQRAVRTARDSAHSAEREAQWRSRFADAQDQYDAMLADLNRQFAADARGAGAGDPGAELGDSTVLRQHLQRAGPGVAALQYVVASQRLHIIVTTLERRLVRQQPLVAARLNETIGRFRQTLQNPRADPRPLGRWLHAELLDPVQADLRLLGVHTLLLQLDGALRYLPFAALVQDDGSYLVESYRLAVYTEAAQTRLQRSHAAGWRVAAMGVTRPFPERGFSALPAVRREIEGIVRPDVLPGRAFIDHEFDRRALQAALATPVVHIATHFRFILGSEASYLLLGDGTVLSMSDVRRRVRFTGVELLALSACDTAVGGGYNEDGIEVEGLGVLAQRQGAQAVLASLWPVADESTAVLMPSFYGLRTRNDITMAEALRQAQLRLLEGGAAPSAAAPAASADVGRGASRPGAGSQAPAFERDPRRPYAHPYFWAPFILMGNWL
ncbi:MAG: CHAT domain-containing protein, partial [Burkholderiales bacterium]|nr:CHAT domain-containing protein [Burkholderiales bacterium]